MAKEKVCTKCGQSFPRDKDHFDGAPRAKDKLTNECKFCRDTAESGPEKTEVVHQSAPAKVTAKEALEELEKESRQAQISMKTCSSCGGEFEATTENFHRNKTSADGLYAMCKHCRNESKRSDRVKFEKVTVGFQNHPGLYDELIALAEEEDRTVEQQIRYMLKKSFAEAS